MVEDQGRTEPYSCSLRLTEDEGSIVYDQAQGRGRGDHIVVCEEPLQLREEYVGPDGKAAIWNLDLLLTAGGELNCVWNQGRCRATLRRVR